MNYRWFDPAVDTFSDTGKTTSASQIFQSGISKPTVLIVTK
jgi:hypothetical protein